MPECENIKKRLYMSIPTSSNSLNLPSTLSTDSADTNTLNANMSNDVQTYALACDAYSEAQATYALDMEHFNELAKSDPMAAFIYFLEVCCEDLLSTMEAQINVFSTSMNISNDLRSFVTDATNKMNAAGNMTSDQGTAFYDDVNDLKIWTNYLSGQTGSDFSQTPTDGTYLAPIDTTNATNLISDCDSITTQFGTNWTSGASVATTVQGWFTMSANTNDISSYAPNQSIKSVQEALQESNSAVSTLSSAQQTSFQYYVQQYNQMVGSINSLMTSEIDGEKSMISNQKTA